MSATNRIQPELHIEDISSFGRDNGQGNLVGIQPFMEVYDYVNSESFYAKLNGYLAAAQAEGWLNPNSIVTFPEYIGTWLVAASEDEDVFQAATLETAVKRMIRHHLFKFSRMLLRAKSSNKVIDSLFRLKAEQTAQIYQRTFTQLAQSYGVTIVAGSVVLPEPHVVNGRLQVSDGRLQNVSVVFGRDGVLYPHVSRKIKPVHLETSFLGPGNPEDLPVFETPGGKLGVLICADSWYPEAYAPLAAQNVQLIVVPNNQGDWLKPWPGYANEPTPADFDPEDVERLTEKEAWLKYALAGRMSSTGATTGIHVFFHGRVWDQIGDGQAIIVKNDEVLTAPYVSGAALINVWLDQQEVGNGGQRINRPE